ncbi:hypothetical protein IWW38_001001 [Coemansia aciculifera]|uniref:Uncharacterized protein n=1 Tax=Coemansia aciculifera TaxID=417176 RepID=A0ACC1M8H4_9FUNG|nr:hypothetical protein IWW38_001001 [Coemansia aciculifera]
MASPDPPQVPLPTQSNAFAQRNGSYAAALNPRPGPLPSGGPRPPNQRPSRRPNNIMLQREATEGLRTMTLYTPLPATMHDRVRSVTSHVLRVLQLEGVPPNHRAYPLYHVDLQDERLGISLNTVNQTNELLNHPFMLQGIPLPWTSTDGEIPTPITICNAPRCEDGRLVAALAQYGRLLHLKRIFPRDGPHVGNWSATLILNNNVECPTSFMLNGVNKPIKIFPMANAPYCPICYQVDPAGCHCPLPNCHPARDNPATAQPDNPHVVPTTQGPAGSDAH